MYSRESQFRFSLALAVSVLISAHARAQEDIPIKRAVLLTTGIGYFQHQGEIDGDQDIELTFNVDDVNDLLKSMVLQDLDDGNIAAISYAPQDPDGDKLQSFDIDLSRQPTMAELLAQLRGEKVSVQGQETISGVILGIETQIRSSGNSQSATETIDLMTLLTEHGIRQVRLNLVNSIKLENKKLNDELSHALAFLSTSRGSQKRNVKLAFRGKGKRRVRIGYVRQTPVWKTSYRLVLNDKDATLQGWAIVENTSQSDWKDIRLSLVSGNPISFAMNLYEPLFVERPELEVNRFAIITPTTHEQSFGKSSGGTGGFGGGGGLGGGLGGGGFGDGTAPGQEDEDMEISQGVNVAATGEAAGVMFEYSIKSPVTLARGTSAMLPIIEEKIGYERLCIFNPETHQKHPLEAIRLTNDSEIHITRGPLTIYDGGIYAGDGLTFDIPPKTSRLVSYAISSEVEIDEKRMTTPDQLTSIVLQENVLLMTSAMLKQSEFLIRNNSKDDKNVLVEVPIEQDWTVVSTGELDETTRDHHRFVTNAESKSTVTLIVQQQKDSTKRVSLEELTPYSLVGLDKVPSISPELKEFLGKISKLRTQVNVLAQDLIRLDAQRQQLTSEQQRIRLNMESIDKDSDLYNRYVKKLTTQEDTLEELDKSINDNRKQEQDVRLSLDELLGPYRVNP